MEKSVNITAIQSDAKVYPGIVRAQNAHAVVVTLPVNVSNGAAGRAIRYKSSHAIAHKPAPCCGLSTTIPGRMRTT